MTCPNCQSTMKTRSVGDVSVAQCSSCNGVFLDRAELGNLVEAEIDWHAHSGPYDYFLTFREGWEYSPMQQPLADGKVRLVAHAGEWRLYQKVKP